MKDSNFFAFSSINVPFFLSLDKAFKPTSNDRKQILGGVVFGKMYKVWNRSRKTREDVDVSTKGKEGSNRGSL